MQLIRPSVYILFLLLILITNVELILFKEQFRIFVRNVAATFHGNWRRHFLSEHPFVRNRFRLTHNGTHYNSSDFIYPMILTVGSCLVHRNLKVARDRYNSSITYIDILNMDYDELPDDWAYENQATARVACTQVLQAVRQKRLLNRNFIEKTSEKIHNAWIKRNKDRTTEELRLPYANLPEIEKDKDRRAVLIACRLFNELHFEKDHLQGARETVVSSLLYKASTDMLFQVAGKQSDEKPPDGLTQEESALIHLYTIE